jgi:hypothetical protein
MKCVDCNKTVGNWPHWLEDSRVTVRCARCAIANATPVNMPKEHTVLSPLTELARKMDEIGQPT